MALAHNMAGGAIPFRQQRMSPKRVVHFRAQEVKNTELSAAQEERSGAVWAGLLVCFGREFGLNAVADAD